MSCISVPKVSKENKSPTMGCQSLFLPHDSRDILSRVLLPTPALLFLQACRVFFLGETFPTFFASKSNYLKDTSESLSILIWLRRCHSDLEVLPTSKKKDFFFFFQSKIFAICFMNYDCYDEKFVKSFLH